MNIKILLVAISLSSISFNGYSARSKEVYDYNAQLIFGKQKYRTENYDKAFQHIEKAAKLGNKSAQYQLALLYLNGQGTKTNFVSAYLWSGVAAEVKEPNWSKLHKKLKSVLSTNEQKKLQPLLTDYINLYGKKAQEIRCIKVAKIGSNIQRLKCDKRLDPGERFLKLPTSSSRG